jgi:hypothetical protein
LENPKLGIGQNYSTRLQVGGFTRGVAFGGTRASALDELPAGAVYATLFPGPFLTLNTVSASIEGASVFNATINANEAV